MVIDDEFRTYYEVCVIKFDKFSVQSIYVPLED